MTKTPCHTKIIPKSKKKARIFAQFPSKIADIAQNPNIVNPHNTSPIPINSSRFCLEPATHNPKTAEFRSKIRQICLKFNQYHSNTVEYCRNPCFSRQNDTICVQGRKTQKTPPLNSNNNYGSTEVGREDKRQRARRARKRESRKEKDFFFYNFSFYNLKYPEFVWSYGAPAPSFGIESNLRVERERT